MLISLFILTNAIEAQNFDEGFREFQFIDSSKQKSIYLNLESHIFFKNNEYFSRYVDGYTLPGAYILPKLNYYPTQNSRIDLGYNLLTYFGTNTITQHSPYISFNWNIYKDIHFTLGSFSGGFNHKLIEPIFSREYAYTNNISNGARLYIDNKRYFADIWIDWEQFIFPKDTIQEVITGAIDVDFNLLNSPSSKVAISYQAIFYHQGGQINHSTQNLVNTQNHALGTNISFFPELDFINSIYLSAYYSIFNDNAGYNQFNYDKGHGTYILGGINTNIFNLNLAYWNSDSYVSIKGEQLFVNKPSLLKPNTNQKEIVNLRFALVKDISKDIRFEARFENYYILVDKSFEFCFGVGVLINQKFFLSRLSNNKPS